MKNLIMSVAIATMALFALACGSTEAEVQVVKEVKEVEVIKEVPVEVVREVAVVEDVVFKFLAKVHLIPKKTNALMNRLNENSQSYIQAEEEELLTLNWHCVGQKPE